MERTLFDNVHKLFRDTARGFVERHLVPNAERFREEHSIDRDTWLAAGARGLLGLDVPERYGGSGVGDLRFNAVLCEELARAGLAFASAIGIQVDVVAPYLTNLTTDAQKGRWLPGFCSGELVTAIALSEPNAGSDIAAIKTCAVRCGSRWILNGSKMFITNGASADLAVVAARTGKGRKALTLFGVESNLPGYSVGRKLAKVGQHEADTAELAFNDVELSDVHVLGEVDRGFEHMMANFPRERLHTAYVNLAHAEAVLERTLDYVKTRTAFGQPIGSFQNSRFALAEAATALDVARAFVDRCIEEATADRLSDVDAAKAKWWAADVQNAIIDACVQLHGGYGYMTEYEVARAWADARVTKIWAGSNEIMKEIIGRSLGLAPPSAVVTAAPHIAMPPQPAARTGEIRRF
jgi:alkylation response protein AidB-like acyl-CoA dehydrogenase